MDQLHVIAVGAAELRAAATGSGDFEDRLQSACAATTGMDFIVTRDPAGFAGGTIPALDPAALLLRISPAD